MNLTNKDITDYSTLLGSCSKGFSVYSLRQAHRFHSWIVEELGLFWKNVIESKEDPKHTPYEDTIELLKEYLEDSPFVFLEIKEDVKQIVGLTIMFEGYSLHRANCLGTGVHLSRSPSHATALRIMFKHLKECGWSAVELCSVKDKTYTFRFIDL